MTLRRAFLLPLLLAALRFVPNLAAQNTIHEMIGRTRDEVAAVWGPPASTISAEGRQILSYPQGRLFLLDDIVVTVASASPARPPAPTPPLVAAAALTAASSAPTPAESSAAGPASVPETGAPPTAATPVASDQHFKDTLIRSAALLASATAIALLLLIFLHARPRPRRA